MHPPAMSLPSARRAASTLWANWAPELAGGALAVTAFAFAQLLALRVAFAESGSPGTAVALLHELPSLALILGMCVASLLTLVLRLLRSNWMQARRMEHSRLSAALDTATDGVWEYDFNTHWALRSRTQLRHLGYDADRFNARRNAWLELVHPDDVKRASEALVRWSRALADDGEVTYRVRAADQQYHTIVDRGRVVERHTDGRASLMIGISADVTERLRADAERDASERRYRAVFESALEGQVLLDAHGRCLDVNSNALAVLGLERHDVIGVAFVETAWFTGLRGAQATLSERLAMALSGEAARCEVETHQLDGRVGFVECSLTPLEGADGAREVLCELRDMTARRRSEDALREIGALSTLGRMAARVAHEINNPLAGIRNSFTLLADAVPDPHPHRRFLKSIDREIDRIAMVTRALYETYRADLTIASECSLASAVSDAVTYLEQVNRGRDVRIESDLRESPMLIPVPDALVRQTLYNLLQNAVEAAPAGSVVRLRAWSDGTDCVLTVSDDGPAISDAMCDRLFEPELAPSAVPMRSGPMGFGLAMVRQSLSALGGTLRLLDPRAGDEHGQVGATFEVRLPLQRTWTAAL